MSLLPFLFVKYKNKIHKSFKDLEKIHTDEAVKQMHTYKLSDPWPNPQNSFQPLSFPGNPWSA